MLLLNPNDDDRRLSSFSIPAFALRQFAYRFGGSAVALTEADWVLEFLESSSFSDPRSLTTPLFFVTYGQSS